MSDSVIVLWRCSLWHVVKIMPFFVLVLSAISYYTLMILDKLLEREYRVKLVNET